MSEGKSCLVGVRSQPGAELHDKPTPCFPANIDADNNDGGRMRTSILIAIIAATALAGGCDRAKSPEQVSNDTNKAEQKGSAEIAKSEDSASKDVDKQAGKVDDQLVTFSNAAAKDAYDVAVAKADANRKVALAQCESQSGSAQSSCKDKADADYKAAKADAKAAAEANKQ
ncbi:MAG TPA: hypothetical protein VGI93_14930 [Steroidobacteraceae bacterium]|jgi:hypothetical protein